MNTKYNIKDKINGKYHTFGNVTPGEKGPRMGLRMSPELRQLIAAKQDGEWLNFLLFPDDGPRQAAAPSAPPLGSDEIPF